VFDVQLQRFNGRALLRLSGAVNGPDAPELIREAFSFIPEGDHVVLDLRAATKLDAQAASALHSAIRAGASAAETIVVSKTEAVSMSLVLHDVDRLCPIVATLEQASDLLDRWAAGTRRVEVQLLDHGHDRDSSPSSNQIASP
jgi:hypothetical protein